MLKTSPVYRYQSSGPARTLFPWHMPFAFGSSTSIASFLVIRPKPVFRLRKQNNVCACLVTTSAVLPTLPTENEKKINFTNVKAVLTAKPIDGFDINEYSFGRTLILELLSAQLDRHTDKEKGTIKGRMTYEMNKEKNEVKYECDFIVPEHFGQIGAVYVENEHHKEIYVKTIVIGDLPNGNPVNVTCNSWVQPKSDNADKRLFFTNKSYLPVQTPLGLKGLREEELKKLQGNGQGERKKSDRIYDYDVYNDIGQPDKSPELARPVLGGDKHPYPRRCRTGRSPCKTDHSSETRSANFYVPRDEDFSDVREQSLKTIFSALQRTFAGLFAVHEDTDLPFTSLTDIDKLFNEGVILPPLSKDLLPRISKHIDMLQFQTPEIVNRDKFSWLRDEEFSRQTLAGLNPYTIQLVKEWPLKSKLDPKIYGEPESKITKELVEQEINGFMSFEEALKQKKLFVLDYHDLLLPYVNRVRELKMTTLYGSRTLFFLTPDGTLRPIAIELTRPPGNWDDHQWKKVFRPAGDATRNWLWRFAKAHVVAHDSILHQLVSHWLRTHCAVEPYIIATNRQLSRMHPIYRLLHPHFRLTMEINALARQQLISAGGIIELTFSPLKYSMELSSVVYDQQWQFDLQALPQDLMNRGMAEKDSTAPHGVKLTIEDYPFANDGLLLWDAIKQWVTDYVSYYYQNDDIVEYDEEIKQWWIEIRTKGHADKKNESWWPQLKSRGDLVEILTTMIWVTSGHHAAVNFGQYTFGGYFPNRPTIARTEMPTERCEKLKLFLKNPELALLTCFPSQIQGTIIMAVLDVLSTHVPDEEYIGNEMEPCWVEEPTIREAFGRFHQQLKKIEGIIDARNADEKLKNRNGAGVVPYELLKPFSGPGLTGKGVPNSISI